MLIPAGAGKIFSLTRKSLHGSRARGKWCRQHVLGGRPTSRKYGALRLRIQQPTVSADWESKNSEGPQLSFQTERLHPLHFSAKTCLSLLVLVLVRPSPAQTYKVGSDAPVEHQQSPAKSAENPQKSLGWGSNIQNARLARSVEAALRNGDYSGAIEYAQRAVNDAPNDPQLWFLLGYAARLGGKLQVAVDAYNKGLRLNPSSADGLSGLAQTYRVMGRGDEAEKILAQVVSADPRRTNDATLLGEMLLQSAQYDRAVNILGRAEQVQPSARAELLIALAYERLHDRVRANQYLELAKRRAPNNSEVERSLAGFYRETGNYSAAIAALQSIRSRNADITAELAYTYQLNGEPQKAAKFYGQAADAAPKKLDLQLSAAQAEVGLGAPEKAESYLERASRLDSDHYRLHAIRGEIARLQDRKADAVRDYTAAIERLPQAPPEGPLYPIQLHMNLAQLDQELEDRPAAEQQLATARAAINSLEATEARQPEYLRLRAMIRMASGDFSGAGSDLEQALAANPRDPRTLEVQAQLFTKEGRPEQALAVYTNILSSDPGNRYALASAGYLSRQMGHDREAEKYFQRLAAAHPDLYIPYLALGDLYTTRREFSKAQASYVKANELAPANSLVIAGAMNAAIEAHTYPLAAQWLKRATPEMQDNPYIMRETERYLLWVGDHQKSAAIGEQAIKKLPKDRDVVVYLGYDLLDLGRYEELLNLTSRYHDVLPKEPDLPLLAGYAHKHAGALAEAEQDFTDTLARDPKIPTAYVNRGFVRNDQHKAAEANADFEAAVRLDPNDGEAHLGLAFTSLELHRPQMALRQVQLAYERLGDSSNVHLIRATAYGQEGMLVRAAQEYRVALKASPNDTSLHLALADVLEGLRHYREAVSELETADRLSPHNSLTAAKLARAYAEFGDRNNALRYVQIAEQKPEDGVWLATGEALDALGEHDAAMQRFEQALSAPSSDTIAVRLVIAQHMTEAGDWDGARRQVALGFMEARAGNAPPPTPDDVMHAANIFLAIHDFQLAESYYRRALAAGASETSARVGLANTYLALGDTARARGEITSISKMAYIEPSYQYLMAKASLLRQEHQNAQALTAFAQASEAAGEDQTAERELLELGGNEGFRVNRRLNFLSDFSVAPVFEDTTVYPLDAKLDVANPLPGRQALLPLPRSSLETQWTGAYHLHFGGMPEAGGFLQIRNARGQISLPSANSIVNRDTTDYSLNFAVSPTVHLGNNVITFSPGIQETVRRDSRDPTAMDQNLFRQFLYLSTSSFFNVISVQGFAIHESGPFSHLHLRSRDLVGRLDFRIGAPWGRTAFITGYGARDLQFSPVIREVYYTSAYAGVERKINDKFSFKAVAEDLRSWRVEINRFAIAQALRPAGSVEYRPTRNWSVQATAAYSRNMGFHAYDALQSGFAVSYAMPFQHSFREADEKVTVRYPLRFSAGIQQESFFNFNGGNNQQFRPYVRISIF
ncbi:MAG: tetratricopeptide repeat protein [Acidobacteria bacterium]|nr:tetratricopeptide repeat protein [Acidobacteriota bacterium]